MLASLEYLTCCLTKKGSIDVSVPQHEHTDVFLTLISAIFACVKTCFHRFMCRRNPRIDFMHLRITTINFAQVGLWHVTRPFPSLAVGWVWLAKLMHIHRDGYYYPLPWINNNYRKITSLY